MRSAQQDSFSKLDAFELFQKLLKHIQSLPNRDQSAPKTPAQPQSMFSGWFASSLSRESSFSSYVNGDIKDDTGELILLNRKPFDETITKKLEPTMLRRLEMVRDICNIDDIEEYIRDVDKCVNGPKAQSVQFK